MDTKDNFINLKKIQRDIESIRKNMENKTSNDAELMLEDLKNGVHVGGIYPADIEGMTDKQAVRFIKGRLLNPTVNMDFESKSEEISNELLKDPQINSIFRDVRKEFPEPTDIPELMNTPGPTPTPSVNIEGFEDVPLHINEQINKQLKQKFMENYTF